MLTKNNDYIPLNVSVVLSSTRFNRGSYPLRTPLAEKKKLKFNHNTNQPTLFII